MIITYMIITSQQKRYTLGEFTVELSRSNIVDFKKVDCQGMTILHVLLLSDIRDVDKCRLVYELYPNALVTRDNHSETPLEYLIEVSGAEDVLTFFFENERDKVWYPTSIGY